MATDFTKPTLDELVARMLTDVQSELPESNPFLDQSWLQATIVGLGLRFYETYTQLQTMYNALFLTTSPNDFLESWGSIWGLSRLAATSSSGTVNASGTVGSSIEIGNTLTSSDGLLYDVNANAVIALVSYSVTLTRTGSVVTATTSTDHMFTTGQTVTISDADQDDYNGDFVVIYISSTEFSYTISTTPTTPATGTITAEANMAQVSITSADTGSDTNKDAGDNLTFSNSISGIDSTTYVGPDGLSGAADIEDDDDYRTRILYRIQNPISNFSISQIEDICYQINGVTRVWVQPTTPELGSVTIYFVRDNDSNIIPSAANITQVKNALTSPLVLPATTDPDSQIIVNAPSPITIDFTFTVITPETSTMIAAIEANLQAFFTENMGVGDDLLSVAYNSIIYNTVDPDTGDRVTAFTLSEPSGDVSVGDSEIGVLGEINY
jgi:uncharacterized phage protein gp47/JayE